MTDQTAADMLAHYSAALDEVFRLRQALAYEARVSESLLSYTSLPVGARKKAEGQVERMRRSARGEVEAVYAEVPNHHRQSVMRQAGMHPTLTRGQWEADRG